MEVLKELEKWASKGLQDAEEDRDRLLTEAWSRHLDLIRLFIVVYRA